jgi:hypothetical protein
VRVLLDEQLPRQLAPYFVGYDVRTTQEQGWAGLKNGALLKQAREAGFDVFVTGDKNLEFQLKPEALRVVRRLARRPDKQAGRSAATCRSHAPHPAKSHASRPDQQQVILDNCRTPQDASRARWFVRHPRLHAHFTPTSASSLAFVEY